MVQAKKRSRAAISDMPLAEVEKIDPAICNQIDELREDGQAPISCDAYANLTLAEVAQRADLPLAALVKDVQHGQPPADNTPPPRPEHREPTADHRESPEQRLGVPMAVFDVLGELAQLQREPAWTDGDRNAKTLVKKPDLRTVLMVLKPGARLEEHFAPGTITLHTLFGRLRVTVPQHSLELDAGQILTLDGGHRHDVEAVEASAFLLTVAW